ncbi:uncharacterized protein [Procambarus clarkii]|uniref:uncharacterized protein n=1 Tax=Procambarus clarkii TaxID=6728 RepID=UPI003742D4DF
MFYIHAVRSLVDYAAPALLTLSPGQWANVEVIQNDALRVITGAPRWTKILNLRLETKLTSIEIRVKGIAACMLIKILTRPRISSLKDIITGALTLDRRASNSNRWTHSAINTINTFDITNTVTEKGVDEIHADFVIQAPWESLPADFKIVALEGKKNQTNPHLLHNIAQMHIEANMASDSFTYFTDGSVDQQGQETGAAVKAGNSANSWRLSNGCSTLQTEMLAIQKALEHALAQHRQHVIIHTDSRTAIETLQQEHICDNIHLITNVISLMQTLKRQGRRVVINWVPSHVGIIGNDIADEAANFATKRRNVDIYIPQTLSQIKKVIRNRAMQKMYSDHNTAVATSGSTGWYKNSTNYEPLSLMKGSSRATEVHLHRIRLGYPCAWEIGLQVPEDERKCQHCGEMPDRPLEHYLTQCTVTNPLRFQLSFNRAEEVVKHIWQNLNKATIQVINTHTPPK